MKMGENRGFEGEIDLPGGSFSRLLLSADNDNGRRNNFIVYSSPSLPPPLFSSTTPKMLCFGDFGSETNTQQNSTLTYSDDSSASSSGNSNIFISLNSSNKRRNGSGQEPGQQSMENVGGGANNSTVGQNQRNGSKKKNKPEMGPGSTTTSTGHAKGKREKLGERVTVLQQLVSPYGKTDTASVLHEAMGYIRFLHDQVKVLSSPYLQQLPSSSPPHHHHLSDKNETKWRESTKGLKGMGLCLVPMQCLVDVAKSNGADFWSSATSPSRP